MIQKRHIDPSSPDKISVKDKLILALARSALWVSAKLPLETARQLGRWCGRCYYATGSRIRLITERNIELAYPELSSTDQRAMVRGCLAETGALIAEMGHLWAKPWREVSKLVVDVEGADVLAAALATGRGVIVFGPHLGNWEMLGLHLATQGKLVALFKPPKSPAFGSLVHRARQNSGGSLVPTTPRGLAALMKNIKGGGVSGILPDQVPDELNAGMNVPFMGVECFTASLACNLTNRSGAIPLMGAAMRVPGGFKLRYIAPVEDLHSDDLATALTAMNSEVERLLRGWDTQYQWSYKRYRTRPQGGVRHYQNLKAPRARTE